MSGNGGQRRLRRRWLPAPMALAFWLWLGVLALFALPAAAQATGNVYVVDQGSADVSQYAIGAGELLSPLTPRVVASASEPAGVALTPDGRSAYVTNGGNDTVSQYTVSPLTGLLSPKTPATIAVAVPAGVAVTPDGRSAYVTTGSSSISQFNIDPVTGALSPKNPATVPAGPEPLTIAVTPDGKSAYVTNAGAGMIAFGSISQYDINPVTGSLSPKTSATFSTSGRGGFIAVTPDGKSAYVTQSNQGFEVNAVAQFDINPVTGALSPKTPATVPAGSVPDGVTVTPDGRSAYVSNFFSGTVSQYDIDPSTGTLLPKTPANVVAGNEPAGIAVTPPVRMHPTAASLSCSPNTFAPGGATACRTTVTDTAGAGRSTPTGTVSFTHSGTGRFIGSPCTLSGSGASASCEVAFTAFPRGGRIMAAAYGGRLGQRRRAEMQCRRD